VRSIVSFPADGARYPAGTRSIVLRGAAWAGDDHVARVELSADAGATWQEASLKPLRNRYDWARWTATLELPSDGSFTVWARAVDSHGRGQPFQATHWNPQGYGCNAMHHIAITVGPEA
jgi:sulfite oxidase